MRIAGSYPAGTVGGACLVTRRSKLGPGERVVDLDIELDDLPPFGRLCLNEGAVRQMMSMLGYELADPDIDEKLKVERRRVADLRTENRMLQTAVRSIYEAAEAAGIRSLVEEPEPVG